MKKRMIYEAWYGDVEVEMTVDRYRTDNGIALFLWNNGELYGCLTVCLPTQFKTNDNCVYLDTNNMSGSESLIEKYGIGKATGFYGCNGYCQYPEYEIDVAVLDQIVNEEV